MFAHAGKALSCNHAMKRLSLNSWQSWEADSPLSTAGVGVYMKGAFEIMWRGDVAQVPAPWLNAYTSTSFVSAWQWTVMR